MAQAAFSQVSLLSTIKLPKVDTVGHFPLETAISQRRSVREFSTLPLTLGDVSQILWAAQGVTHRSGLRTVPSAGALYPLMLYVLVGNVNSLESGIYIYKSNGHALQQLERGKKLGKLAAAAFGQFWINDCAAAIVIAANYTRHTQKYDKRAERYVHMEVGNVVQNIYLEATALSLGTTMVGAFMDNVVAKVVGVKNGEQPLAIMPLGKLR